jgi:hypothetical protein
MLRRAHKLESHAITNRERANDIAHTIYENFPSSNKATYYVMLVKRYV